ncbi:MAG TPA: AI-2E family transporter [Gemmatimonadaceae bacterium]|nr:AI-2E family transporter [Gemmatimonadaceae bacterium]
MSSRPDPKSPSDHPQSPPGAVTPPAEVEPTDASEGSTSRVHGTATLGATPPVHRERRRRAVGWQSKDILRAVALGFGLYLLLRLLWFANQLVIATFLGVLFGLAVSSGVDRLQRFRIPRGIGAAMIVVSFYALLVGFGYWMAPTIREQGMELRRRLPVAVDRIEGWIDKRPGLLGLLAGNGVGAPARDTGAVTAPRTPEERQQAAVARAAAEGAARGGQGTREGTAAPEPVTGPDARSGTAEPPSAAKALRERLGQQLSGAGRMLFPFLSSTVAVFAGILLITFLAIYIAADPKVYHDGLMHLFPKRTRHRAGEVLTAMATVLRKWLVTQLIAMAAIGAVTTVVLLVLQVKAAFALGLLAGLLEFIPTIGPILSAVPAIAMGLVDSPEKALSVAIAYIGIQFLENHILIPMLMKGGVDIPPALTVLAQALLALVFGFLGLMVAVPALAATMVGVKMLYVEGVVGDQLHVLDAGPDDDDDDEDD